VRTCFLIHRWLSFPYLFVCKREGSSLGILLEEYWVNQLSVTVTKDLRASIYRRKDRFLGSVAPWLLFWTYGKAKHHGGECVVVEKFAHLTVTRKQREKERERERGRSYEQVLLFQGHDPSDLLPTVSHMLKFPSPPNIPFSSEFMNGLIH
jgi:hypothetical protein